MKVLQIIPVLALGGAETMCENLTYELIRKGHKVIVLSLYSTKTAITERMEKANVDIRYLDKKSGFDISMFKKIRKILREENPDAVHTHLYALKYVAPVAHQFKDIKVVHTVHNIAQKEAGKFSRCLNKFLFKRWKVTPVALSEVIRDTVVETYKISQENVPFVYNGVDLTMCEPKKTYEIDKFSKIVHVGRFGEAKNHIGLVKAFHKLCLLHPECKLYLIGDGAGKANIENYVMGNGFAENVVFMGAQSNVFSIIKDMDIFVLPSIYEGIPLSLVEAMGTALPIVATNVGGIPDMVVHGESAILVDIDVDQISDALKMLVENKDLRESLGKNALIQSKIFSAKEMADKYLEVYSM